MNNTLKQNWIYKYLEWDEPEYIHYGLVSIPNTNLKTSKIRESIQNNEFSGWDDCRLATLKGLARRGYRPETFLKYWENSGLKEVDIKFSWQNFNAMNKDFIDSVIDKVFDLMEIFSKNLYVDFRFNGSNSLKNVLPVLIEGEGYENLDVQDGAQAITEWEKIIFQNISKDEKKSTIDSLLEYCKYDTYSMIKIYNFLVNLS